MYGYKDHANSCAGGSYLNIETSGDETDLDCTPSSSIYIKLYKTHESYSESYALLLSAHENQRTNMNIRVVSGTGSCTVDYIYSDN